MPTKLHQLLEPEPPSLPPMRQRILPVKRELFRLFLQLPILQLNQPGPMPLMLPQQLPLRLNLLLLLPHLPNLPKLQPAIALHQLLRRVLSGQLHLRTRLPAELSRLFRRHHLHTVSLRVHTLHSEQSTLLRPMHDFLQNLRRGATRLLLIVRNWILPVGCQLRSMFDQLQKL